MSRRNHHKEINPHVKSNAFFNDYGGLISLAIVTVVLSAIFVAASFSLILLAVILGLVFENRRLSSSWLSILGRLGGSVLLSLGIALEFLLNADLWPFLYIIVFGVLSLRSHKQKLPHLTRGQIMIQSLAIIYWLIDYGIFSIGSFYAYGTIAFAFVFAIFAIIYAIFGNELKDKSKFLFSAWSALITSVFGIEYILSISTSTGHGLINDSTILLQYFLVGVSAIYTLNNLGMLFNLYAYRPDRYGKINRKNIREMKLDHAERVSEMQVHRTSAILALILVTGLFSINYYLHIMPTNTAIWLIFWIVPYIIMIKERLLGDEIIRPRINEIEIRKRRGYKSSVYNARSRRR